MAHESTDGAGIYLHRDVSTLPSFAPKLSLHVGRTRLWFAVLVILDQKPTGEVTSLIPG